jgi:hypothetical protein
VQALRLLDRPCRVRRQIRVDLERDVAVLAAASVPDRAQEVQRVLDVFDRQAQEDLLRVALYFEQLAQLLVVGGA